MAAPIPYGPPIGLDDAKRVMAACEAVCRQRDWPMVIAIVDSAGRLILHHTLDGAQTASVTIAKAKADCALGFRRATREFEDRIAQGGANLKLLALPGMVPVEGGVPLIRAGAVIGAVGVSGMASHEDGEVAKAGAAAIAA